MSSASGWRAAPAAQTLYSTEPKRAQISPDLAPLVQHVIDRPGFRVNGYIGFMLEPDVMPVGEWAEFADSAQGSPATLELTYREAAR